MRQAAYCSGNSIRKRWICKTALLTVRRAGSAVLLLMTLGFFLLFNGLGHFQVLQTERRLPCSIEVSGYADLQQLHDLPGVAAVTPLGILSGTLEHQGGQMEVQTACIWPGFLPAELKEGTVFAENTYVPQLVLNEAAATSFFNDETMLKTEPVTAGTELLLNGEPALVCGILSDGEELPRCYMSYTTGRRLEASESGYMLRLFHSGDYEKIEKILQEKGLRAAFDQELLMHWKVEKLQILYGLLSSCLSFICAALLLRNRKKLTAQKDYEETLAFLASGFSRKEMALLGKIRLALTVAGCAVTALLLSFL